MSAHETLRLRMTEIFRSDINPNADPVAATKSIVCSSVNLLFGKGGQNFRRASPSARPPRALNEGEPSFREPEVETTATRPQGWRFQARYNDGARIVGQPDPRQGLDLVYACDPRSPRGTQAGKFRRRFLSARAGLSSGRKSHPEMGEVPAVHLRCCYADRHQRRPHDARRRRPGQVLTRPAL